MLNFPRYVILMLAASLLNGQYFNAKFVPTVNPPKGYYIDLSITFKSDGTVILKKNRPVIAKKYKCVYEVSERELYLSGRECDDMINKSVWVHGYLYSEAYEVNTYFGDILGLRNLRSFVDSH
ncbi:hypothetical protein FOL47_005493 [Perkinsus chesapeaki]|uniref:Uncharacterized protein n=1 Tax=Perkinsus chesapeaki TaxID=330153 RepID=A0A7J6LX83_PERCH|nr:hypothetical protein FOL47_005493 [Perkinsus chesapeaki]